MRKSLWVGIALALLAYAADGYGARTVPYTKGIGTILPQRSDTTEAVRLDACVQMIAVVQGSGCDSTNMVLQASLDGENWVSITTGTTAVTNVNLATGGLIRNPLAVNSLSAGNAWITPGFAKFGRIIVKNNADTTGGNADTDTLVNCVAGFYGLCK